MSLIDFRLRSSFDEYYKSNGYRFNFVSLFAGGGGSSTGYRMSGGKALLVNEFIEEARKTYKANWKDTIVIPDDIRSISGEDILNKISLPKYSLDILDGSPPCSAFSTCGTREKGWGKVKKYSDSKQGDIQDLFFEYIRILKDIMPKVFIAENVAGMASGKAKGYLNIVLKGLKSSGYHVEAKILDASRLSIPQTRNRLIFVGVRNDLMKDKFKGLLHPKPKTKKISLMEAFSGLEFSSNDMSETDIKKYKIYEQLKTLKPGEQHKKRFSLIKADPFSQSGCITATSPLSGAGAVCHWDNRAFSIGETKRIMSVPDDYILTGTYKQKIERMGRMVPPLMMKAVADNVLSLGVLDGDT